MCLFPWHSMQHVASTWKIEWNVRIPWKSVLTDHKFLQIMRKLSIFLLSWSPLITHVVFRDHLEVCNLKDFRVFSKKGQRLAWVAFKRNKKKTLHVLGMLFFRILKCIKYVHIDLNPKTKFSAIWWKTILLTFLVYWQINVFIPLLICSWFLKN